MISKMLFKRTKKYVYISIGCLSLYAGLANAQSNICNPTDPLGVNSENLCPSHPSGISSESFRTYTGRPYRALPTVQDPAGVILVQPKGFWTEMTTTGSSRVIRESSGNSYQLSK